MMSMRVTFAFGFHFLLLLPAVYALLNLLPVSQLRKPPPLRHSTSIDSSPSPITTVDPFWKNGLQFGCTGCGKCCQNDGEVWLDIDEFVDLVDFLKISAEETLEKYVDGVKSGWVKLKNKVVVATPENIDRCIFLDDDGKKCTVYSVRPVQCRTYPWWPRLMTNQAEWNSEAVVPDEEPGKHWSADKGGCEGINHKESDLVSPQTIYRNYELYRLYNDAFPFLSTGTDAERLLTKAGVVQGIIKSTREWVKSTVIKHQLCPFAESVFASEKIRYRVYFGSDKEKIKEKLRYEVLTLLTTKEEDLATTLLMLPFACRDFEEFYDFSLDLEEIVLPLLEKDAGGPTSIDTKPRRTLLEKARESKGKDKKEQLPDVQLAFFHPGFCWADTEPDDAINFEKRAPFPTINLLRAFRIREYADER